MNNTQDQNRRLEEGLHLSKPSSVERDLVVAPIRSESPMHGHSALAEFPTAIDLARGLVRRWRLIALLGVLVTATVVGILWMTLPAARYTAQAMLHVSAIPPRWIQVTNTHDSLIDFQTYQRTQTAQLKSKLVLSPVLNSPDIRSLVLVREQKDPLAWLERELQIRFDGEILRISLSDERPDGLAEVVNKVVENYLREVVQREQRDRAAHRDQLKRIYENAQNRLKEKRRELDVLVEQTGASGASTIQLNQEGVTLRREMAMRQLQELRQELRRCLAELAAFEDDEADVTKSAMSPTEVGRIDSKQNVEALRNDERIQALQKKRADLDWNIMISSRAVKKKTSDSTLQLLRGQREHVERLLADREDQIRSLTESRGGQKPTWDTDRPGGSRSSIEDLRRRSRFLEDLEEKAEEDVRVLSNETLKVSRDSIELELMRSDLEHIDAASKKVGNMVESLTVELNAPSRILPLEKADTPRKQSDKRFQIIGLAGVSSFGLVALVISFLEFQSRRVGSPEEVIRSLPLTIIGTLPAVPTPRRAIPILGHDQRWQHILLESVDTLRALLIRARQTEDIRSIMVTSSVGGEGKTSLAAHLSASLARAGLKTLLIDGDLRHPTVHRLFDLPLSPGLAEALVGEVKLEEAIIPVTPLSNFWVLAAGGPGRDVAHLLAQSTAHELFARTRTMFDFVVVDTAPVLPVADTLLIGQHLDCTIFSILRTVSRLRNLRTAQERLERVGIKVLGAVVTGVRSEIYGLRNYEYESTGVQDRKTGAPVEGISDQVSCPMTG